MTLLMLSSPSLTTPSVPFFSQDYYHFFDNRVLPPHVDAELAMAEGWWYKPEYVTFLPFTRLDITPLNTTRLPI